MHINLTKRFDKVHGAKLDKEFGKRSIQKESATGLKINTTFRYVFKMICRKLESFVSYDIELKTSMKQAKTTIE